MPISAGLLCAENAGALFDLGAVQGIVGIGANQHFGVRESRLPVELALDFACIENKIFRDHLVVIRAERRYTRQVCQLQRGDGWAARQGAHPGFRTRSADDRLEDIPERTDVIGADVEEVRSAELHGHDARRRKVVSVNELVAVAALADEPYGFVVINKLEQNGEQPETAAVDEVGQRRITACRRR